MDRKNLAGHTAQTTVAINSTKVLYGLLAKLQNFCRFVLQQKCNISIFMVRWL